MHYIASLIIYIDYPHLFDFKLFVVLIIIMIVSILKYDLYERVYIYIYIYSILNVQFQFCPLDQLHLLIYKNIEKVDIKTGIYTWKDVVVFVFVNPIFIFVIFDRG